MNADEDEAGYEVVEHPCQPTPIASSQQCRTSTPVSSSKFLPPMNDSGSGSGGPETKSLVAVGIFSRIFRTKEQEKELLGSRMPDTAVISTNTLTEGSLGLRVLMMEIEEAWVLVYVAYHHRSRGAHSN
ncbi:hypothetical protein AAL_03757 [Moelleriella libera RCEF 2490]|uniref:Uncharacterized protein n=1 Tax=Moelleriella libera RCEF 2490 TaxID=1081109 RepID=A0A168CFF0_9HYPO|nr:hypothetical protein AAL_03757 [Moelleriella libera RCEF 2490]